MNSLGKRVSYRRRILGLSQRELGKQIGISQQAIERLENDATKNPRNLLKLADSLGLDPHELVHGTTADRLMTLKEDSIPPYAPSHNSLRDLPVMGAAQGGPDGNLIMNDDPIDWTDRPQTLLGVTEAFAVYITGDSMSPKYEDGDLLYIHPNRPFKKGRYVVIETTDQRGYIKQFRKWDETDLIVRQFNPAKDLRIPRASIERVMLVIGSMDS
ncbi:S24 family peptidase [Temperatibacter marinus]|uniref:S24 family peptidase n=1 Tax=Temperatibacter marinus TaxID=1456591 RepID=A0AA52EFB2_9PROT|nr:S24 family peptidase [Temperatibacter marinus]WND02043.1 S24 family peptidase [Temperatibacter marinus]